MIRTRALPCLALLLAVAAPARAQHSGPFSGMPGDEPPPHEVVKWAVGGGVNLLSPTPGWQGVVSIMGENREKALLTQISLALEQVATQSATQSAPTGRVTQVTLTPAHIYAGYGALRAGVGFDAAWAFNPEGAEAESATGFGWGGRAGGGLALYMGGFNVWLLGHYRWMTGTRVSGWFIDLLVGPE